MLAVASVEQTGDQVADLIRHNFAVRVARQSPATALAIYSDGRPTAKFLTQFAFTHSGDNYLVWIATLRGYG